MNQSVLERGCGDTGGARQSRADKTKKCGTLAGICIQCRIWRALYGKNNGRIAISLCCYINGSQLSFRHIILDDSSKITRIIRNELKYQKILSRTDHEILARIFLIGDDKKIFKWSIANTRKLEKLRKYLSANKIQLTQIYLLLPNRLGDNIIPLFEKETNGEPAKYPRK